MADDRHFDVRIEPGSTGAAVVASGEIDLATSGRLRDALVRDDAQAPTVVLDLRAVTFLDSSGLGVIVGQNKRAKDQGFRFVVAVDGAPTVKRILELSGLSKVLEIVTDPDTVLTA